MGENASRVDVIVVGAGLIGLASAYELAKRGACVRVLDAREPGRAASWAGAGMLTPHTEEIPSCVLEAFAAESLARYPVFARELHERGGVDARLALDGVLRVAYDDHEMNGLVVQASRLQTRGIRSRFLNRELLRSEERAIGSDALGALLIEDEGQVDNRRLARALHAACAALGVQIEAGGGVQSVEVDPRRVRGVRTPHGFVSASIVINAAGAWAGMLEGLPAHARVPVMPVKGQMLALWAPRGLLRRVLWVPGAYIVPRADGRVLVGATVERVGFDVRVTAQGVHALLDAALRALPALGDLTVTETWAGVRPGSADGLPFIGATALDGYFVAAGHYRYGIVCAPSTGHLIADAVEGRGSSVYADAFSPRRFADAELLSA